MSEELKKPPKSAWRETRRMNMNDVKIRLFEYTIYSRAKGEEPFWLPKRQPPDFYEEKPIPQSEVERRIAAKEEERKKLRSESVAG